MIGVAPVKPAPGAPVKPDPGAPVGPDPGGTVEPDPEVVAAGLRASYGRGPRPTPAPTMADDPTPKAKSYGNMSDDHWSRTRDAVNAEALDYYRQRNHAPGVEGGGEARNFYCMECDGVVPWDDFQGDRCPHCGAAIEGAARRYFNWVEIDRVPARDRTALLLAGGLVLVLVAAGLALLLAVLP